MLVRISGQAKVEIYVLYYRYIHFRHNTSTGRRERIMVFNVTFNNISVELNIFYLLKILANGSGHKLSQQLLSPLSTIYNKLCIKQPYNDMYKTTIQWHV
jgi:hypothetical protein